MSGMLFNFVIAEDIPDEMLKSFIVNKFSAQFKTALEQRVSHWLESGEIHCSPAKNFQGGKKVLMRLDVVPMFDPDRGFPE